MPGYLGEDDLEIDDMFPAPQVAARQAATWSAEAGYVADESEQVRVLEADPMSRGGRAGPPAGG